MLYAFLLLSLSQAVVFSLLVSLHCKLWCPRHAWMMMRYQKYWFRLGKVSLLEIICKRSWHSNCKEVASPVTTKLITGWARKIKAADDKHLKKDHDSRTLGWQPHITRKLNQLCKEMLQYRQSRITCRMYLLDLLPRNYYCHIGWWKKGLHLPGLISSGLWKTGQRRLSDKTIFFWIKIYEGKMRRPIGINRYDSKFIQKTIKYTWIQSRCGLLWHVCGHWGLYIQEWNGKYWSDEGPYVTITQYSTVHSLPTEKYRFYEGKIGSSVPKQ